MYYCGQGFFQQCVSNYNFVMSINVSVVNISYLLWIVYRKLDLIIHLPPVVQPLVCAKVFSTQVCKEGFCRV